jgi:DHA1 family tetracycline resistance protein-like MFS transporter
MALSAPAPPPVAGERRHGRNAFLFIILTVFIDMMAFAIIFPVLPKLIAELLYGEAAVTAAEAAKAAGDATPLRDMLSSAAPWGGYITAFYAILNFLMQPVLGNLSDRFGRRPVLLVSMATLAIDFLIMGFAHSIWLLFIGRLMTGISGATHATASAYIADTTEPENRAKAYGMLGVAFGTAFILGPVIGGLLGTIDPRAPFFASAAFAGLNFLYGLFVLPESLDKAHRRPFDWKRANAVGAFLHFRKLPHLKWFLLAFGLYSFGHWVYPATFTYYGQIRYGWDEAQTGWALGAVGLGQAIVQGALIGVFIKTLGASRTAMLGFLAAISAVIGYIFAYQGWMVFLFIPLSAMAGVLTPALNQIMSARVERNAQGELAGAQASIMALASIFSPLAMTQTLHFFTSPGAPAFIPGAAFLLAAGFMAIAIVPLLTGLRLVRKVEPEPSPAADDNDNVAAPAS